MAAQRDKSRSPDYFREFIERKQKSIAKFKTLASETTQSSHRKRLLYSIFRDQLELWIARYSAGEKVLFLKDYFYEVIDSLDIYLKQEGSEPMDFRVLADYIQSLWIISIALLLDASDDLVAKIIKLINQSEIDAIFDRLIQLRFPDRYISSELSHSKPYLNLYKAIPMQGESQSQLIHSFIKSYYKDISEVYWMDVPPEYEVYFGNWLFELAALVKGLEIDDQLFINNANYPSDLVH